MKEELKASEIGTELTSDEQEEENSSFILHPSSFTSRLVYFGVTLAVLLADQASKLWTYWVLRTLPDETIPVIGGCFNLRYAENPGIAFSFLGDSPPVMRWVLLAVAVLAALGVFIYSLRIPLHERWLLIALSLILGGILGNACDRITYGAVVDFLHVYWHTYHWPIFNLADSFICTGAIMLTIDVLWGTHHVHKVAPQANPCPEP